MGNFSSSFKNGPHSTTGSVTSSNSHSPAGSLTNTMTSGSKLDDSNLSHSGPTTSEKERKVKIDELEINISIINDIRTN